MVDRTEKWLLPQSDRFEIAEWFAGRAGAVDRCQEPAQQGLHMLATRGMLSKGIPESLGGDGGGLEEMAEVIATVAGSCLTSGFVLWCHRMFLEYLAVGDNPYLTEHILPQVLKVERLGATGLANAMKHAAAIEEIRVRAEATNGGYVLTGRLPWVSNLVDDRFIVALAVQAEDKHLVAAVPGDMPGLACGRRFPLFGLEGTASASLVLDGVSLDDQWVIAQDAGAFLGRVRPTLLLLQSALAWGLAESALTSAHERISGPRTVLKDQAEELNQMLSRLVTELRRLAREGVGGDPYGTYRVLKTRKELAELAVEAVWLELETAGGAGYLSESETARRLREAAFFPVQSPSFVQLRSELAQYEASYGSELAALAADGEDAS